MNPDRKHSSSLWRRLQIALPFSVGIALVGLLVFLLVDPGADEPAEERPPVPPPATPEPLATVTPISMTEMHQAIPPQHHPAPEKPEPGLKRWKIDPLPEGWDPELALRIAQLFDKIDYDLTDPEAYVEAKRNLDALDDYLASLGPDAVPTLAAILNHESFFINRRHVILALGNLGPESEDCTFHLHDFFMKRHADLKNSSELNYVVKAMGELRNESSFGVLRQLISDTNLRDDYRAGFIRSLGEHPRREESKALFVENMFNARPFKMRNNAAQALKKIGTPDLLPDLESAFEEEPYWVAKQTILGAMGRVGSPQSISFLARVSRTARESGVRLSAASAIRRVWESTGSSVAEDHLHELSETEPDASVRRHIISWLR